MNQPPAVQQMSPTVRYIFGGIITLGVLIFIFSMHRKPRPPWADIKGSTGSDELNETPPTPLPTMRAVPYQAPRSIIVPLPPKPTVKPTPKVCQICIERLARYYKAIETGFGGDMSSNIRELPIPGHTPIPQTNIFAYEPPSQP